MITKAELVEMVWQTRVKVAMGQGAIAVDPWHNGRHAVFVRCNADHTVDRELQVGPQPGTQLQLRPQPWPQARCLPRGELHRGWGTWAFPERCGEKLRGPIGSFLRMGRCDQTAHSPTRGFVRHPKHWVRLRSQPTPWIAQSMQA